MKAIIEKIYPYITILLFPIFFVNRLFLENYLFYGEERGFLNYDFVNYRYQAIWESSKNFGAITANHLNIFTTGLFWKITTFFGLSWWQSEALFYYCIITITLLFAFFAFKKISKNTPFSLLLGLIYITTFNYYATITTTPKLLHVLLLPSTLFFWLLFKETKHIRYFIANILVLILCLGIGSNPPQMIGAYSFIFLYMLVFDLKRENMMTAFFFYFPYVLTILFVFSLQLLVIKYSGQIYHYNAFAETFAATQSSIHEIIRFFGAWWDYDGSGGLMYNHMGRYYHSLIGIITTYIPFILFIFLLGIQKKQHTLRNRLIILSILMLFLVKGSGIPFGEIFSQAYTHIDLVKIFREPWAKFISNFIFVIYVGIAYFITSLYGKTKKIVLGLLMFLLLFQIFPLALQQVIDHRNISWKISDVNIPEYWEATHTWSKSTIQNKRVLVLPAKIDSVGTLVQNWRPFYYIGYPEGYFIYADLINSQYDNKEDEHITSNFLKHLQPSLLALGSIEYVIDKKDLMQQRYEQLLPIDKILPALDTDAVQNRGGLDIYPVKKTYTAPRIRTVNTLKRGSQDCAQFFARHAQEDFRSTAVVAHQVPKYGTLSPQKPQISRISSTEYKIEFRDQPRNTAALFFGEAYNTGWQLYDSPSLFAQPLNVDAHHFRANCFGNLWLLPTSLTNPTHPLYLRFTPQLLYERIKIAYGAILISFIIGWFLISKNKPIQQLLQTSNQFSIKLPAIHFLGYRLLLLYFLPLILLYDFLTPRSHSDLLVLVFSSIWLFVLYCYQARPQINLYMTGGYLILTMLARIAQFVPMADTLGMWTSMFLLYTVVYSALFNNSEEAAGMKQFTHDMQADITYLRKTPLSLVAVLLAFMNTLLSNCMSVFIKLYRTITSAKPADWVVGGLQIGIILAFLYGGLVVYKHIERGHYQKSLYPIVTSVEPVGESKNQTITITGSLFARKGEKPVVSSNYGEVPIESYTPTKITFPVPSKWKSGPLIIWVVRVTLFEGKYVPFASKKTVIQR